MTHINNTDLPIITIASTDQHFQQILDLQAANATETLTAEEIQTQGFITARHSTSLLQKMAQLAPQFIALSNGELAGYVLSMHPSLNNELPVLRSMFDLLEKISFDGKPIADHHPIIAGQTCIAKSFRGTGLLERLYATMQQDLSEKYGVCVTEIAVHNTRSMRAHERIGFEKVYTHHADPLPWNIVLWNWSKPTN